jgi:hypothetical protein
VLRDSYRNLVRELQAYKESEAIAKQEMSAFEQELTTYQIRSQEMEEALTVVMNYSRHAGFLPNEDMPNLFDCIYKAAKRALEGK